MSSQPSEANGERNDQRIIDEYTMYCGITKDLESFKNPSSVQVIDGNYNYSKSHDKFIAEIRATNSFGGYTSAYFYVTSLGASQIDWSPAGVGFSSYRGEDYYKGIPFYLPETGASYISSKY